jgi:hypothetical protein
MARYSRWFTQFTACCLVVLTACGPSGGSGGSQARGSGAAPAPQAAARAGPAASPELQALIDSARQEATLSLVWGEGTVGGTQGTKRLAEGFNASTPYAAGFDRLPVPELWGEQRTMGFITKFAEQLAGRIRCNEIERVASGEFDILALDCGQGQSLTAKANGAPTGFTMAADAPFAQIMYLAVPRNAAHPNAAKLWINYMLSREAQDLLYEMHFADLHWLPGSKSAADIASFTGPSVIPIEFGVGFYLKHDETELDRPRAEIQRILTKQ